MSQFFFTLDHVQIERLLPIAGKSDSGFVDLLNTATKTLAKALNASASRRKIGSLNETAKSWRELQMDCLTAAAASGIVSEVSDEPFFSTPDGAAEAYDGHGAIIKCVVNDEQRARLNALVAQAAVADFKSLVNNALTLVMWEQSQKAAGYVLVSVDEVKQVYVELSPTEAAPASPAAE